MCEHETHGQQRSESIAELAKAMAKAQADIGEATRSKDNPFFKSKYADMADIRRAAIVPLSSNGLAVIQTVSTSGDGVVVTTTLAHSSGEWISDRLVMRPTKNDPQGLGSAISYARRYAWATIAGVATADDDGNRASGRRPQSGSAAVAQAATGQAPQGAPGEMAQEVLRAIGRAATMAALQDIGNQIGGIEELSPEDVDECRKAWKIREAALRVAQK